MHFLEKCTADLGFVLDQSSSINRGSGSNFLKIKEFVNKAATEYGISKYGVRAGVLVFSSERKTRVRIHFRDCYDTKCFTDRVDKLPFEGGQTRADIALKKAKKDLFDPNNGHRPQVPAFIILITDGGQSGGKALEKEAKEAANALKKENIMIIPFGIKIRSNSTEENFLSSLADGFYNVSDFSELQKYLKELMKNVCKSK